MVQQRLAWIPVAAVLVQISMCVLQVLAELERPGATGMQPDSTFHFCMAAGEPMQPATLVSGNRKAENGYFSVIRTA